MKHIAIVEPDGSGGMIHYAYQLADALHDTGARVTLHTSRHYELHDLPHRFAVEPKMHLWPAVAAAPRPGIVAAVGRKTRRLWRGFRYAAAWWRLTTRLIEAKPDMALFSIIRFPFQAIYLRRLRRAGIRLAQVCHEFEPREKHPIWRGLAHRVSGAVYRSFDAIFLHGEQTRDAFLSRFAVDRHRIHVIRHPNEAMFAAHDGGADDRRDHYDIAADAPVVLFFGAIRPSKGFFDLLEAFPEVNDATGATLLVAGTPVDTTPEAVREAVSASGAGDAVRLDMRYFPIEEVGAVIRTATVVALPYRSAMASGVLQVAFTFGKPVVATRVGALAEDVDHGETGLLVEPADTAALAAALVELVSDPERARRMGEVARSRAATGFGWDQVADAITGATKRVST